MIADAVSSIRMYSSRMLRIHMESALNTVKATLRLKLDFVVWLLGRYISHVDQESEF